MKCTNSKRYRLLCTFCIAALFMTGCGSARQEITDAYPVYSSDISVPADENAAAADYFANDLCRTADINFGTDLVDSDLAEGAGVFNLDTKEVVYSQNLFRKLYPASTTKIMTAYLILKNVDINETATVSAAALDIDPDSSTCSLREGDQMRVEDLLYGLMLVSGNDAANVLAEHCSGSIEAFVELMNQEAKRIGATNTHFMNANGLPDENHYTTVYDMYLIMAEAIQTEGFETIISTLNKEVSYWNSSGDTKTITWRNTNRFMTGKYKLTEGFTLVGGKTGTTGAAGYCLVLFTYNEKNERIISIVFKAGGNANLYSLTNQILSGFAK